MEAQTFTIDLNSVLGSPQVNISSIDLYFKKKPLRVGNISGVIEPGVTVYIVPTAAGGIPNYSRLDDFAKSRKEFSEVVTSIDATTKTKFTFNSPIAVQTGQEYAIVIKSDNKEEFELWASTQGEINVSDKSLASGLAGKYIGRYFHLSSESATWQSLAYKSLKFTVNVAKYSGAQPTIKLYMNNYEFVTYDETKSSGLLQGGERVYQDKADDGTLIVTQGQNFATTTGGAFNIFSATGDDSWIVVKDTNGVDVRRVIDIRDNSNTIVVDTPFSITNTGASFIKSPVAIAYVTKKSMIVDGSDNFVVLANSSANSTTAFTNNSIIKGEHSGASLANAYFNDIIVHRSEPHVYMHTPPGTSFTTMQIFDYTSTDDVNGIIYGSGEINFPVSMYSPIDLDTAGTPVMLKSRSNEVRLRGTAASSNNLNSRLEFTISNNNDYVSPAIDFNATDVFFNRYIINNDATDEHTNNGYAYSKHITNKISFGNNRQAEDILVYLKAYKPSGTDIKVYAKVLNNSDSDYFDDKNWTLLQETSGNRYSSLTNLYDFVEYTYGLSPYPESQSRLPGTISIAASSNVVTGIGTTFGSSSTVANCNIYSNNVIITNNSIGSVSLNMNVTGYAIPEETYVTALSTVGSTSTITLSKLPTVSSYNQNVIFSSGLMSGDLVKIYPSLFPENYVISSVSSVVSSTSLTLGTPITSSDISNIGSSGLVIDKLLHKHQAFSNKNNNNTIRYYNTNMTVFDKYDTFAIKVVFLSDSQFIIPKIKNIRALGVSA